MNTFAKTTDPIRLHASADVASRYDQFIQRLEGSYFGLISMAILIGSCLGGITTMMIFENNSPVWQFIIGLGAAMANLVAAISQAPTKWVVNLFATCLIVNTILLLINVL